MTDAEFIKNVNKEVTRHVTCVKPRMRFGS